MAACVGPSDHREGDVATKHAFIAGIAVLVEDSTESSLTGAELARFSEENGGEVIDSRVNSADGTTEFKVKLNGIATSDGNVAWAKATPHDDNGQRGAVGRQNRNEGTC